MYETMGYAAIASAIIFLAMIKLIVIVMLIAFVSRLILGSRTYRYRKELVDMYVVGKVKKYAGEEGIDLVKEMKEFKKSIKLRKDLDDQIEEKISERVGEEKLSEIPEAEKPAEEKA